MGGFPSIAWSRLHAPPDSRRTANLAEGMDALNHARLRRMMDVLDVPSELQIQPEFRFHAQQRLQPERRCRESCRGGPRSVLDVDPFVDSRIGNLQSLGKLALPGDQEFFLQHFAGIRWSTAGGNSDHWSIPSVSRYPWKHGPWRVCRRQDMIQAMQENAERA